VHFCVSLFQKDFENFSHGATGSPTTLGAPTGEFQHSSGSPAAEPERNAMSTAAAATGNGASAGPTYVDEGDEDDEDGMIVHAGFGAPQKPLATSAVGAPVFLGLDGEEEETGVEAGETSPDNASAHPNVAKS
jgi:hypothetical protein